MMDIFQKQLTNEELARQLGIEPEVQTPMVPEQEIANQVAQETVANPYTQPKEEISQVETNGIDQAQQAAQNFDATQLPEADVNIPEKKEDPIAALLAQYEEGKAERANQRGQAQMLDAFEQINRSLAGQAGHKIEKGTSNVSQLPKDQNLQELLTKYQMLSKGKGKSELEQEKIRKTKAEADIAERKAKEETPSFAEKEMKKAEIKEGVATRKENRQMKKDMEASIPALDEQLANIKKAKEAIKGASFSATGPVDQYTSKLTAQGQKIEQALNSIALDKMVKMFSGMSKAIDSDAERAFFQSAQPSMGKYESVNLEMLDQLEEKVKGLQAKTKDAMKNINDKGEMKEVKVETPTRAVVRKQYSPSRNKTKLIYSDGSEEIVDGRQ